MRFYKHVSKIHIVNIVPKETLSVNACVCDLTEHSSQLESEQKTAR